MKIKFRHIALLAAAVAASMSMYASAANEVLPDDMVDLANQPLNRPVDLTQAGPNVMFILDDGGEMATDLMPASLRATTNGISPNSSDSDSSKCAYNYNVNKLAYNPKGDYKLPVKSINPVTGAKESYPAPWEVYAAEWAKGEFKAALDGYGVAYSGSYADYGARDLKKFNAKLNTPFSLSMESDQWSDYQGSYYYKWTGAGDAPKSYPDANGRVGFCGSSNWTKVTPATLDEWKHYAIWFSYYRIRINMLKSVASTIFADLDDTFRVGFMSATQGLLMRGNSDKTFVNVDKFDVAQKNRWLAALAAAPSTSNSVAGLPWALSTAGRYFGGHLNNQKWQISGTLYKSSESVNNPAPHSCQVSSSIIAGAGYYTRRSQAQGMGCTEATAGNNTNSCKIDGTKIVDLDSTKDWPFKDQDTALNASTLASLGAKDGLLSDVSYYYANTNIRTGDPMRTEPGKLPGDPPKKLDPFMATYVVALGAEGNLKWVENYAKCTVGDCGDYSVINNPKASPRKKWWFKIKFKEAELGEATTGSADLANATVGGEGIDSGKMQIDDHWHAAVNGDGTFFNASSTKQLAESLKKALDGAGAGGGSGTGATATTMLFSTNTGAFVSSFKTVEWTGDLQRRTINEETGAVGATYVWKKSAAQQLDERVLSADAKQARTIYVNYKNELSSFVSSDTLGLVAHLKSNKYFEADKTNPAVVSAMPSVDPPALSQYAKYSDNAKLAATGENGVKNMIDYLRGARKNEMDWGNAEDTRLYRPRKSVLGDMVNSPIVYVGNKPTMDFTDAGYADTFKTAISTRKPTVYVGANDGMLHAFDAETGAERWAFIPKAVLPNLHKLADFNYSDVSGKNHRYFVDGHITVQDAYFNGSWRTVLIGGLGKGGRSYYALDITGDAPSFLWEFTDDDLGYTYGGALVVKNAGEPDASKKWVAVFGSGYNNKNVGNGKANLFMIDLKTGGDVAKGGFKKKFTATNGSSDPVSSGLTWVNGWTDGGMQDASVRHVYGGDLGGNVWRFDLTAADGAAPDRLAILKDADGNAQPVTSRPELGDVLDTAGGSATQRTIYIGTGRFLGDQRPYNGFKGDPPDRSVQSIYGIRDDSASLKQYAGSFRSYSGVVSFTASGAEAKREIQYQQVTARAAGWYMDFPAGERVTVAPLHPMGDQTTLLVASSLPSAAEDRGNPNVPADPCKAGGKAYVYAMQTQPVAPVKSAEGTITYFTGGMVVGTTTGKTSTGKSVGLVGFSGGKVENVQIPMKKGGGDTVRRTSWRELIN